MDATTAIRARARAQAKIRQAWIDDLHRHMNVTLCEKLVGTRLALHQNLKTLKCYPSATTLAAETGIPERSVYRALDGLKHKGRIKVKSGGRGRANEYFLVPPTPDKASGVTPDKATLARSQANLKEAPSSGGPKAPLEEVGEREDRYRDQDSSLDRGRAPSRDAARSNLKIEPAEPPQDRRQDAVQEEPKITAAPMPPEIFKIFAELRAVWRRGWDADDTPRAVAIARQVFAKLVAEGAEPAAMLAAAKRRVAAADAPRYLPQLVTWLVSRGFESEPPAKKRRQKSGALVAARDRLPRTNGKVDITKVALMQGGYVEDENGNLYHPDGNAESGLFWLRGAAS